MSPVKVPKLEMRAIASREDHPRLARSKILAPVDSAEVWSVTCFFVRRDWRRRGVTMELLNAAARWVAFVHHGLLPAFAKAGVREVARRSKTRPVVRRKGAAR